MSSDDPDDLDDPEVTQLQYSLIAVTMAALVKAQQSVGAVGGSDLAPYLNSTVRREPSGAFVVTRPDGVFRAVTAEDAVPVLGEGFLRELAASRSNPDHTFMRRQVDFINGPAFRAAEAFLKSVDPSYGQSNVSAALMSETEPPAAVEELPYTQELDEKLREYAHAVTWNDAFVILRDNPALLLTSAAASLLQSKLDEFEAGDLGTGSAQFYAGRLYSRLNILQAARAYGLDEAWRGLGPNVPAWSLDKEDNPNWVPYWKTR